MDFLEEPGFGSMEITVVGLGLIGGSFAMALNKLKPKKIWAVDVNSSVLEQAEKTGVISKGFTEASIPLQSSDIVVICIYPELAVQFVKDNLAYFKHGALITDTAGLKEQVVQEISSVLREDLSFVGGHPLAGKESSGFAYASEEIFRGANYLITPIDGTKNESLRLVERLILGLGCRQPIRMEPHKHDEIIALTSQLPHVIAAALMNSSCAEDTGSFVGGSFRDATRVARMNAELWSELLLENKDNILEQIDVFIENVRMIRTAVAEKDRDSLKQMLENAGRGREKF
ncbi:MAG: prephenate dehydrogenase [Dehalobacter sp.]|nr:prephenate dehydrogenase [Dehalobacter sp.]